MEELRIDTAPPAAAKPRLMTGAEAIARAMKQLDADVIAVNASAPPAPIMEAYARLAERGAVSGEVLNLEPERAAMSAASSAALAGGRAMAVTASPGMAWMVESIYRAALLRAPVLVPVGSRAVLGPAALLCDHAENMLAGDSGAIQLYGEDPQEAYDLMLLAARLAEDPRVLLPVLLCIDCPGGGSGAEPVAVLPDGEAERFVGRATVPHPLLDLREPTSHGAYIPTDYLFELKRQQAQAMEAVPEVWAELSAEFEALTGRSHPLLEAYRLEDADRVVVLLGMGAATARGVVDELRAQGERVGLLRIRGYRPLPAQALRDALAEVPAVAVLERTLSPGGAPPLFAQLTAALFGREMIVWSYVYGIGGRELDAAQLRRVFIELLMAGESQAPVHYLGLRV
jgi:pyruvate ferredoxin oxidoreductase alpha subunit